MQFRGGRGNIFAAFTALGLLLATEHVQAQQPTQDQISAIRQSCRSDFMANCPGVQPGGKEALECLKRNLPKLSGGCKTAVSAVGAPAAVPAARPVNAPQAAPPAGHPATAPQTAVPPPAPAVAALRVRPFIMPQRRLVILAICNGDVARLCGNVPPGRERILECLGAQAASLSPECYRAVARVSVR